MKLETNASVRTCGVGAMSSPLDSMLPESPLRVQEPVMITPKISMVDSSLSVDHRTFFGGMKSVRTRGEAV